MVLVGNLEGKRPLGMPRCRWRILKLILEKCDGIMIRIHLAEVRDE
jgi:hypothetical protein